MATGSSESVTFQAADGDVIKLDCNNAWYKEYDWRNGTHHYFVNDLLGQRIPITREQYNDENLISPN